MSSIKLLPGERFQLEIRANLPGATTIASLPPDGQPLLLGFLQIHSIREARRSAETDGDGDGPDDGAAVGVTDGSGEVGEEGRGDEEHSCSAGGINDMLALVGMVKRATSFSLSVSRLNFFGAARKAESFGGEAGSASPDVTISTGRQQSAFRIRNLSDEREIEVKITSEVPQKMATVVELAPAVAQLLPGQEVVVSVVLVAHVRASKSYVSDENEHAMRIRVFDIEGEPDYTHTP